MGETLSDMFELQPLSGSNITAKVSLKFNTIIINYYPRLIVYEVTHTKGSYHAYKDGNDVPTDDRKQVVASTAVYEHYLQEALNGWLEWQASSISIHGVSGNGEIHIWDKSGVEYKRGANVSDYDFSAATESKANVVVYNNEGGNVWVPDAIFGWSITDKKKITIHNLKMSTNDHYIFEHEFGHVLGLFDAYGYENKSDTDIYNYGGHKGPQTILFPPAPIDGMKIQVDSVMICNYQESKFIRTNFDWTMILFAWQNNKLQTYIETDLFGDKSQAFYHEP